MKQRIPTIEEFINESNIRLTPKLSSTSIKVGDKFKIDRQIYTITEIESGGFIIITDGKSEKKVNVSFLLKGNKIK